MITFEEIIKKHPRCFTKQSIRNQELYGSCIPTGWGNLLDELCSKIEVALAETDTKVIQKFTVTQIKEKFGMLRFSCTRLPIIEDLITEAVRRSGSTCVFCGSRGSMVRADYISPLCKQHFAKGVQQKLLDLTGESLKDAAINVEIYNSVDIFDAHLVVHADGQIEKYGMRISDFDLRFLAEMLAAISVKMNHVKFLESSEENDLFELTVEEKSIFESVLNSDHIFHSDIHNRISELSTLHEEIKILAGEMRADFGQKNLALHEKIDVLANRFQDDFVETQQLILERMRNEKEIKNFNLAYRPLFSIVHKMGLRKQNQAVIDDQCRGLDVLKNFLNTLE